MTVGRLLQNDAVSGIQMCFYRIQSLSGMAFPDAYICKNTESLGFYINLSLFTLIGADFVSVRVVGS